MSLIRYLDPFADMRRLSSFMDEVFNDNHVLRYSDMDVIENENEYVIQLDVPGFTNEEIVVEVSNDKVLISAEKKIVERNDENDNIEVLPNYLYRARRNSNVKRRYSLRSPIDSKNSSVELRNGVLTVTLKKSESSKPRRIEVKSVN
jgi:HSP20 family protein